MYKIYMLLTLIIGIILSVITFQAVEKSNKCTNVLYNRSLRTLLILSIILVVSSLSFFVCIIRCDCASDENKVSKLAMTFFILLGLSITSLGAVVHIESLKSRDCDIDNPEYYWIIGLIITVFSSGFLFFHLRGSKKGLSKKFKLNKDDFLKNLDRDDDDVIARMGNKWRDRIEDRGDRGARKPFKWF